MLKLRVLVFVFISLPVIAAVEATDADPNADARQQRADAYYHMMRASLAAQRGAVRALGVELRQASKLDPNSAELRAEGAALLLSLGQFIDAEKMARSALEIEPHQPKAVRLLAEMATRRAVREGDEKSRAEAIRLYEILAADEEPDADALRTLARLKFAAGDLDGAIEVANRLARQRKGDSRVAVLIAQMYGAHGKDPEALGVLLDFLVEFGSAETLVPEIIELGRATGAWDRVEQASTARLQIQPISPMVLRLRGEARLQSGDARGATADLQLAVEYGVGDPMALFQLTTLYDGQGRLGDAVEAARSLSTVMPDNPNIQAMLGEFLARQRDWGGALEALNGSLEAFSGDAGTPQQRDVVRRRIASVHLERGHPEMAVEVIEQIEDPEQAPSLELAARVALDSDQPERARSLAARLQKSGERGSAALIEGEALAMDGKPGRAEDQFRRAVSELGSAVSPRIAEIWRQQGQPERGEKVLRSWVRSEPENADAHFSLGGFLERERRVEEAEASLRRAFELEPRHANALNYLGYMLADRGLRLEEAVGYIERALEIEPWNGAYLDSLGWVYFRMGRLEQAREPLERAARELPGDPTVLEHLGDLYLGLEQHELAVRAWRRALNAGSDDPERLGRKIATEEARLRDPDEERR